MENGRDSTMAVVVELVACIICMCAYHGCSGCGQQTLFIGVFLRVGLENTARHTWSRKNLFDFVIERNFFSTTNECISSEVTVGGSKFPRDEAARNSRVSIWNVKNVCETNGLFWICEGGCHHDPDSSAPSGSSISVTRMLRGDVKTSSNVMQDIRGPDYCVDKGSLWVFIRGRVKLPFNPPPPKQ